MGNKWTDEQLAAITETGCNLLVAAAAGAGKTAVLVERIIRKITDEKKALDIDRMLIVTFTNAAAAEMRERIGDAISKALDKNPESRQLQRQMTLLNKASITTIHSFCLEVIRNNFQYIDIDPNFRIADGTETALLKLEALEELFEERYEDNNVNDEFLQLVESYGGSRDDSRLQELVMDLYEFVQSYPWPEQWLKEKSEAFNLDENGDFGATPWAKLLLKNMKIELSGISNMLLGAIKLINKTEGLEPYLACFEEDLANVRNLVTRCDSSWNELYEAFKAMEFSKLARCGKDVDKVRQVQVKDIRDEVKKKLNKIKDDIFIADSAEIASDMKMLYPLLKCLVQLVLEFGERYAAKKKQKSLLDFNDLEHYCLKILTVDAGDGNIEPSKTAVSYRERFEEILVDEYQDSNLVQEVMLGMISRRDSNAPNVFMVGDVKQSIYRFRQAKPELFLEKYNTYGMETGALNRKILLFKNFRSRNEVITGVNFVFTQIMSENVGELDYSDLEALNPGAEYDEADIEKIIAGGAAELHLIDLNGDDAEFELNPTDEEAGVDEEKPVIEPDDEKPDLLQTEARVIVKRIKELMAPDEHGRSFHVFDKNLKAYRKLDFRDIVILLRTTKNWADVFVEELGAQGIPAYADSGAGYFRTIEVQVMLSLLQIIDNPMQDIPLLSVLRSPIGAFTAEELIDIRLEDSEISFYQAMRKMADELQNETARKSAEFLAKLGVWRDKALYMSTDELIWYLYSETGYFSYVGAMPGGVQRQANLRILFERARQYEKTSYKGLFNFINFINKLKSSNGDMGSAKILGENENVVRVMSIHKSKGLEFPVVFVSGCGKSFNLQDLNRSILMHQDLGFGPDFVDYKRRIAYPSVPKQALRYKAKIESFSEEMRILYVAFTRAREKLIITGCVKDLGKSLQKWARCLEAESIKLPEYEMLSAKNYLDWICSALMRHKESGILRELVGLDDKGSTVSLIDDVSRWEVKLWSGEMLNQARMGAEQNENDVLQWLNQLDVHAYESGYQHEIQKRLEWKYPYTAASRLPTKVSVTELKKRFSSEVSEEFQAVSAYTVPLIKRPAFMEEVKGLSPSEKGTVLHFVMQHLNLKRIRDSIDGENLPGEVAQQIRLMVKNELLTEQQANSVDIRTIQKFWLSSLGGRILRAEKVYREIPFNLELKSTEVYKELDIHTYGNETLLMQGVVDCYFEEEGKLILVDYKTDYVPQGDSEALRSRYSVQIDYYARALERLTGKSVSGKYIYLFWNGEVIEYS